MAFFGAILTLLSGGAVFADSCKTASIERETREEARRKGNDVWVDNKGDYRLVGTNEKCYIFDDKLKSLKDGRVIVDYKHERVKKYNDEAIAKAKAEGKKYCYLKFPEFSEDNRVTYLTELDTGRRYYLQNYGRNSTTFIKGYYSKGHGGISTMLTDWKDERIKITKEEFKEWGGYLYCNDTGVFYEFEGRVL